MRNSILSKEEFISVINSVRQVFDYQNGLNDYFRANDVDGYLFQPDCTCDVITLLHFIFGDLDDDEWISYFCFELDFGRKWKEDMILDKSGNSIRLSTPEELYDFLIQVPNSFSKPTGSTYNTYSKHETDIKEMRGVTT
jgi:hypothetical protein